MIPIKKIMKKDFGKISSIESVESAVNVMEKKNVDYLLIEEKGGIKGMVTSRELVGYPFSRLILDCVIQEVGTISGKTLVDEALKVLEENKVKCLVVLNKEGNPIGVVNRNIIIYSFFQELKKLYKEKEKYITELKRTEEQLKKAYQELKDTHVQLLQAGKMAAMGEMAAGIAHELTQPLLGIRGFTAALLEDMKRQLQNAELKIEDKSEIRNFKSDIIHRATADLEVILQQADRMTKIVNMIRDFARASGTEIMLVDINQSIEDALLLFSEQLRLHNIVIEKNLASDSPYLMGNANQLQQVFINLIANARDAMDTKGGEGRLTITTGNSADSIYIEVEDTGIGADLETASRMFEPFFTTKMAGKGTGLGLSIVDRIIKEHGGAIDVKSEPGRGCKFSIRLPLVAG